MKDIDALIQTATDATLTTDNWQYILDVCDAINLNPEKDTKVAMKSIVTRLSSKDANVILRTLSLLIAIAENCGSRIKQEIASKSFLNDNLIKKLGDRKIHKAIKIQIVQTISQLNDTFKSDPLLKPMADAYTKVKSEYPQYLPPSKPEKHKITTEDKSKEDEELQRILKLSMQEYEREQSIKTYQKNKPLPDTNDSKESQDELKRQNTSTPEPNIATVSKVKALYDLISYEPDELSFRKGDVITVIESVYRDWWRGLLTNGKVGIFPLNYVTPIVNKSPEELHREIEQEDKILEESRKVDRLLALLSSQNPDENEITQLYNEVIPNRPQLSRFIDKYGVRKEELFVLNNQLNSEVKEYNELMDNMIASKTGNYQVLTPYPSGPQREQLQHGFPTPQYPHSQSQSGLPSGPPQLNQQNTHQQNTPTGQPFQSQIATGEPPHKFQSYNPTGAQQYNPNIQQQSTVTSQHTASNVPHYNPLAFYGNAKPTGSYGDQYRDIAISQQNTHTSNPPPTSFGNYPPSSPGNEATGTPYEYQKQQQQYLQQQPTSAGFGNSSEPDYNRQFLNINSYPEVNNL